MKTELGVSVAVLAALAAHGKDFDRATLNAMLDKLAASPEPKQIRGPIAMCYSMMMPETEEFDFVCKKCGKRTHYEANRFDDVKGTLAFYRDAAVRLRGKGLAISVDDSALCSRCCSLKSLGLPTGGVVIAEPTDKEEAERFGLRVADMVSILNVRGEELEIRPSKLEYWIFEKYLDATDKVAADDVWIRYVPLVKGRGACQVDKGTRIKRCPRRRTDPQGWARIELPECGWNASYYVNRSVVGNYTYDEDYNASAKRVKKLAWIINGVRTVVERTDPLLLERFLNEEVYFLDGEMGPSESMKSKLPRLRELLGDPKK